jgi:iron complex outermembrane receptor protein
MSPPASRQTPFCRSLVSRRNCGPRPLAALLLGAAAIATIAPALADSGIEEIVVTSRKQLETVQETPIAVTALGAGELQARGLTNITQLTGNVPNLTMEAGAANGGGSNSSVIFIRGVGQVDFLPTTDPGVGIYIDGIYYPRSVGSVMDLLDLERVEVLRGPQGTLFGKNTIGGAINMVSTKPGDILSGYGELTLGKYDRVNFRGSVDVPLIADTLNGRFAVVSKKADGYAHVRAFDIATSTPGKVLDERGNENKLGLRSSLHWMGADDFTADLILDYSRSREKPQPLNLLQYTGGPKPSPALGDLWNALVGFPGGTPMSEAFISGDKDISYGTQNAVNDLTQWGVGLTLNKSIDNLDLVSITGYRAFIADFGRDGDGSPLPWTQTLDHDSQHQFSQEFQLNGNALDQRLSWTSGLFFFNEQSLDHNRVMVLPGLYNALEALPAQLTGAACAAPWAAPGCAGNPINSNLDFNIHAYNKITSDSYAAFGQANYNLTDQPRITAGLRYTYETKEYTLDHHHLTSNTYSVPYTVLRKSWVAVTPMGGLDYQLTDDIMVYTSVSRGFKSGGFNGRPRDASATTPFDPEYVTSYEAGFKSEWFQNRLRVNVAAFYSDYTKMQFTANVYSAQTGSFDQVIANVGEARIKGVELEVQAKPTERLSLHVASGYTNFAITRLNADVPGVSKDSKQPYTPNWTASGGFAYTLPVGSGDLSLRGDWVFEGTSYLDIQNTPALTKRASNTFNARLSYALPAQGWTLSAFETNLTNQRRVVSGLSTLDSFGQVEGTYNRPREWGVSVRKDF